MQNVTSVRLEKGTPGEDGLVKSRLGILITFDKADAQSSFDAGAALTEIIDKLTKLALEWFGVPNSDFYFTSGGIVPAGGTLARVARNYGVILTKQGTDELAAYIERNFR